jgi:hypothetical protein
MENVGAIIHMENVRIRIVGNLFISVIDVEAI